MQRVIRQTGKLCVERKEETLKGMMPHKAKKNSFKRASIFTTADVSRRGKAGIFQEVIILLSSVV